MNFPLTEFKPELQADKACDDDDDNDDDKCFGTFL